MNNKYFCNFNEIPGIKCSEELQGMCMAHRCVKCKWKQQIPKRIPLNNNNPVFLEELMTESEYERNKFYNLHPARIPTERRNYIYNRGDSERMTRKEMKEEIEDLKRLNNQLQTENREHRIEKDGLKSEIFKLDKQNSALQSEKEELAAALKKANSKLRNIVNTIHPEVKDGKLVVPDFKSKIGTHLV